jgi:hypothetical protein
MADETCEAEDFEILKTLKPEAEGCNVEKQAHHPSEYGINRGEEC